MLRGVGTDILHVARLNLLLKRRGHGAFARRILTTQELHDFHALPLHDTERRVRFLAVRWALKEATYKALFPTLRLTWKDVTASRGVGDKPLLTISSHIVSRTQLHCSVSHDGEYVLAFVVAEAISIQT
ncbi:4'-phosphopantetheinyl transferase [Auriculariales sp. MPI-PUGE-AT-0066]|nr:4'-phosphopantetheinyl transferase [Auriculariales sp. MPI-PUGE-AT-0066]